MPKKSTTKPKVASYSLWRGGSLPAWASSCLPWLAIYIIIGLLLILGWYRYQINPDAISYMSIAKDYAHLDLRHAINGYWSPLFSWLLVPFVWARINLQVASKLISLFASTLILYLAWTVLSHRRVDRVLSVLAVSGLALTLLCWALPGPITPDILFVLLLFIECVLLLRTLRNPTRLYIVLLACSGALLYFSKAFGIYVFSAQVVLAFSYSAFISKTYRSRALQLCAVLAITFIILIPWVCLLSIKYHRATLTTASAYNLGLLSPKTNGQPGQPMDYTGPFAPPNKAAVSAWEDPSHIPVVHWSPISSMANFTYYLSLMWANLVRARDALVSFGAVATVGFVLLIADSLVRLWRRESIDLFDTMFVSAALLVIGYSLVWVEDRYIWALAVFGILAITRYANALLRVRKTTIYTAGAILTLGCLWFSIHTLVQNASLDRYIVMGARPLARILPSGSNVLTNDTEGTATLSYFDGYHSYGLLPIGKGAKSELATYYFAKKLGAGFYLYNKDVPPTPQLSKFLATYASFYGSIHYRSGSNRIDLTIYKLR